MLRTSRSRFSHGRYRKSRFWKGNTGNKGIVKKCIAEERAGAGNAMERSSKVALVVKKRWFDVFLVAATDWEQWSNTSRRERVHIVESEAGGGWTGQARLVDFFELSKADFARGRSHHCLLRPPEVLSKRMFACLEECRALRETVRVRTRRCGPGAHLGT